ncbi:MAG: hypothetical protein RLZZ488_1322 [Pseudomonadota bacterium]|jgi:hypothetical protein
MKTMSALAVLGLVACGQSNENTTQLATEALNSDNKPLQNEGEEQLGIVTKSASMSGAFKAVLNSATNLAPAGALQAFGAVSTFTDAVTKNKCSGAFAYEPDPKSPKTHVNLYYYTATHCFETVNPLGVTTSPVEKSVLRQSNLGSGASFTLPFGAANKVAKLVKMTAPEIQYENNVRTDVIRFFQARMPLILAVPLALPTCPSAISIPKGTDLIAGVMAVDSTGIVQANSKERAKLNSGNVLDAETLSLPNSGIGRLFLLDQVGTIPGESGSPVWLIDGDREITTTKSYLCLQGVVSRELITPEWQPSGSIELKLKSYFSPILPASSTVNWRKVL